MPISFNTGTGNSADTSAAVTLALPSGILVSDVMIMSLTCFNENAAAPAITFSGADGPWTLVPTSDGSANPQVSAGSGIWSYGYAYYRVATAGDPGATLTVTASGAGFASGTTWWAAAVASYTTVNTASPVDVAGGAAAAGGSADVPSVTCPSLTTGITTDWAVYLGGGAPGEDETYAGPYGTVTRENILSGVGIGAAVNDSGGSAGSVIGGGTFTTSTAGVAWLSAFTIGLAPADGGGYGPPVTGYRMG